MGTNNGSSTGFGNVNVVMHDKDSASVQYAAYILIAYNQLVAIPTDFITPLLVNDVTLFTGVYSIPNAATLNQYMTLDAKNVPNAKFIFQIVQEMLNAACLHFYMMRELCNFHLKLCNIQYQNSVHLCKLKII